MRSDEFFNLHSGCEEVQVILIELNLTIALRQEVFVFLTSRRVWGFLSLLGRRDVEPVKGLC